MQNDPRRHFWRAVEALETIPEPTLAAERPRRAPRVAEGARVGIEIRCPLHGQRVHVADGRFTDARRPCCAGLWVASASTTHEGLA